MANRPNPTGSRKISFNVSEQYDIQDVVGEGAYGVVWYVHGLISSYTLADWYVHIALRSTSHLAKRLLSRKSLLSITPCFA
jgi:hypothetical protein